MVASCSDKQGIATDMLQLMERFFEEHMLITVDALQLTTTQLPQSFEEAIQRTINVQQVRSRVSVSLRLCVRAMRAGSCSVARLTMTWGCLVCVSRTECVASAEAAADSGGATVDRRGRGEEEDERNE